MALASSNVAVTMILTGGVPRAYAALMGLNPEGIITVDMLDARRRQLSRICHPDRVAAKGDDPQRLTLIQGFVNATLDALIGMVRHGHALGWLIAPGYGVV